MGVGDGVDIATELGQLQLPLLADLRQTDRSAPGVPGFSPLEGQSFAKGGDGKKNEGGDKCKIMHTYS